MLSRKTSAFARHKHPLFVGLLAFAATLAYVVLQKETRRPFLVQLTARQRGKAHATKSHSKHVPFRAKYQVSTTAISNDAHQILQTVVKPSRISTVPLKPSVKSEGLTEIFDWHPQARQLVPFSLGLAPEDTLRTCDAESLALQAQLVFEGWNECGYIEWQHGIHFIHGGGAHNQVPTPQSNSPHAVISGPADDAGCTVDKMNEEPCKTEYARYLARNDPNALRTCMARIRGLSQTCDVYDRCGPQASVRDDHGTRGICGASGVFDYFKEPDIQRMCGVCSMKSAVLPSDFVSPPAGFKKPPQASGSGLLISWHGYLLPLVVLLQLFFQHA